MTAVTSSTTMTTPEGIPIGQRLDDLADADPQRTAVVIVHRDGSAEQLSRRELNEQARRWGRALAARGGGMGDRVALPIHNSFELVLGALGAWEVGATPVPVRWDLPDWERDRVLAVIGAAVVVDEQTAPLLREEAAQQSAAPFAYATPSHSMGICSSGSTGTPKVILNTRPGVWTPEASTPFAENFGLPL